MMSLTQLILTSDLGAYVLETVQLATHSEGSAETSLVLQVSILLRRELSTVPIHPNLVVLVGLMLKLQRGRVGVPDGVEEEGETVS